MQGKILGMRVARVIMLTHEKTSLNWELSRDNVLILF